MLDEPGAAGLEPLSSRYGDLVAEHGSDSIVVTGCDGRVEWCNPAFHILSGFSLDEMMGRKPGEVLQGAKTDPETVAIISEALKERRPIRTEILNYSKSGEEYWIELNITPIFDESGRHTHFMSIERDVTDRKRLERERDLTRALDENRRRERRLVSLANEWLHSTKSIDELLTVVKRCMDVLIPGSSGALYLYNNSRDILEAKCYWGSEEQAKFFEADDCWALRRGRVYTYGLEEIDFRCSHAHDTDCDAYLCIPIVAHGDTIGLLHISFHIDKANNPHFANPRSVIEARREIATICAEQISLAIANAKLRLQLEDQSMRDQLTGLWNRRWFLDVARKEINKAVENKNQLCLISIDVDHFKKFNDRYGHDAGDLILREMGAKMMEEFTGNLFPCRLGGEEFAVLIPACEPSDAIVLAQHFGEIMRSLEINYHGEQLPRTTISAGVAVFPDHANDIRDLLKAADVALYRAKENGRDQVVAFLSGTA